MTSFFEGGTPFGTPLAPWSLILAVVVVAGR